MHITQHVCCPNCGNAAMRHELSGSLDGAVRCPNNLEIQLECPACDYLLVTCSLNGAVVEAYAPGLASPTTLSKPAFASPFVASVRTPSPSIMLRA